MRYGLKYRQSVEEPTNPAVITFHTASASDTEADEIAARLCGMMHVLAYAFVLGQGAVEEIVVSPNAGGEGRLLFPTFGQVKPFIEGFNASTGDAIPVPGPALDNDSFVGSVMGNGITIMLPKGTSMLVTEQANAGPKGRLYLPFPNPLSNTATGTPSLGAQNAARTILGYFYGFRSGTPEVPKVFGVKSASGFSLISGLKVSERWSHLKSRSR